MTLIGVAFNKTAPNTYTSLAPTFITYMNMLTGSTFTPPGISQLAFTGIYMFYHSTTTPFYFLLDAITTSALTDRYVFGVLGSIQQVDNQLTQLSSTLAAYNATAAATSVSLTAQGSTLFAIGTTNFALGTSNIALGNSNIALGMSNVAIGTTITAFSVSLTAQSSTIYAIALTLSSGGASSIGGIDEILQRIGSTLSSFGTTSVDPGTLFGFVKRNQEVLEGDQTFNKVTGAWDIMTRGGTLLTQKSLSQTSTNVTKS